ncbi:unnamed protein product [Arabidopsis lyrata]|nr:unnamed protein product [Arabidopsis lyrata]
MKIYYCGKSLFRIHTIGGTTGRDKKSPRQHDFKHKDTGEALWLDSDIPDWITRRLEFFDQRNRCYDEEKSRRGRLSDYI